MLQSKCVECYYPCESCINTRSTCTSCVEGFTKYGWKCMSTFNYGASILLQSNQTNFNDNYQAFLLQLASAMQTQNYDVVTVQSIYPVYDSDLQADTVTVVLNLSTYVNASTNNQEAITNFNNIVYDIGQAVSIGGMTVLGSTTIEVNGGYIEYYTNLGLILGIALPLGFLVIGGIAYLVCLMMDRNSGSGSYANIQQTGRRTSIAYELKEQL